MPNWPTKFVLDVYPSSEAGLVVGGGRKAANGGRCPLRREARRIRLWASVGRGRGKSSCPRTGSAFPVCGLMSYDLGLHYLSEEEVDFDGPPIEFADQLPSPGPLNNAPDLLQAFAKDGDVIDDDLLRRVIDVPVLALAAPEGEAATGRNDGGAAGDVFVADSGERACCCHVGKVLLFSGETLKPDAAEISPTLKE
ncbi:hypothetical protein KFL_007320060 [Klebsormidium nitens]|uniref:Uncharacterized protein n=1 Tax=Klebsormidium nitens TaxID=105231 RepID=A0A1Y1IKC7_KLENI|nr:hypothetical protein KFL_007320060 [Klebsormidium nitens]|eukprot:GAQ91133.1 hypothetical protein KFL_007320060 [Klebsormidium nitens]